MSDLIDCINNPNLYQKELYRAFKRIFAGTIKENFLINMVKYVEGDQRYKLIFIGTNKPDYLVSVDRIAIGNGFKSANICKMIVMAHYANTVDLNEHERGKKQDSKEYKEELTTQVIKMFRIEKLAAADFSNASLESYLPLIYYISAITNFCENKYHEYSSNKVVVNSPYDSEFNYKMIYKLLMKIKACINLSDIRATDELMVIYRSLIELFMTYSALWDKNSGIINSFYEFDQAAFDYNYGNDIPERIKLMAKDMGVNEIKFVNYGWIKNLEEFKELANKKTAFSLSGLGKILDKKCGYFCSNFGSELHKFYKACNPQTHGTMLTMNCFQLELHIFQNIAVMLKFICEIMSEKLFGFDFKIGNFDLIDELNAALNNSRKVYAWLNENQKNLDRTNMDYRNRAMCSLRMKNN